MDLWSQLIGRREPTLVVVESDTWVEIPGGARLDRAMERRARKEQWDLADASAGFAFHVLLVQSTSRGVPLPRLEVDSLGIVLAIIDGPAAAGALTQMAADGVSVTACKALASRSPDGSWAVRISL